MWLFGIICYLFIPITFLLINVGTVLMCTSPCVVFRVATSWQRALAALRFTSGLGAPLWRFEPDQADQASHPS